MEVLLQVVTLFFVLGTLWYLILITSYESYLHKITRGIEGKYSRDRSIWKRVLSSRTYSFDCLHAGRQFSIHYRYQLFQGDKRKLRLRYLPLDELEFCLPVVQKFWLRILPQQPSSDMSDELVTGLEIFDRNFLIHTNQPDAAIAFLRNHYVQDQFTVLRNLFSRLEIHRGWMKVLYSGPQSLVFQRSDLQATLEALTNWIQFYEGQQPMTFRILHANSGYCPYCRETLHPKLERIVECSRCSTHLHESCWHENAHCTTWGCASTTAWQR